jgi:nitronate monooxygenase
MAIPQQWKGRVRAPILAAPMFLVSNPALAMACCRAGVIGSFPALNQRSTEGLVEWLETMNSNLSEQDAPYAVNLIVHKTNPRLQADLEQVVRHQVPLVITSLGAATEVVEAVHSYGGLVFHDVVSARHAQKAAQAGVDGIIPVAAGAGGHAGTINPFALVPEVRRVFDGYIVLSGCIGSGEGVAAAIAMGADFAYMGTRFIATEEGNAPPGYKQMILEANAADIVYTPHISGVPANFLRASIERAGMDPDKLQPKEDGVDFGTELSGGKAWKEIWSAGQGVGQIHDVPAAGALCERLISDYEATCRRLGDGVGAAA